jgi:hypothetical protein
VAHQARRQVQAALHATGEALGGPVGRVDQVELFQQLGRTAPGGRLAQVVEPPDELEVLPPGELLLNGCRLPGQPDRPTDRGRFPHHVVPVHQGPPRVRQQQRGQDTHGGRLARAVRPEDAEHGPLWHRQVDATQRAHVPERLGQTLHQDRRPRAGRS